MRIDRVFLIVLDGVGVGELPDAADFGDVGSNSLGQTARVLGGLRLPQLGAMGLGNLTTIDGVPPRSATLGAFGKMAERSAGKCSTVGHWEIAGVTSPVPLPVYPEGFPAEVIATFEGAIGRATLGNRIASGTVIIGELGDEHVRTGRPIVYTSADSVFQVAAHESVIPVEELYRMCEIAREQLVGPHAVGRVIARPFVDDGGAYLRTARRRDWSLPPPRPTILDSLSTAGLEVIGVGKIDDLFARQGLTGSHHTLDTHECVDALIGISRREFRGLVFVNLIEFDMLYGHRNDPRGYGAALEEFDTRIPDIAAAMATSDMLM
ncbi:MAG: phosphopentomutase, partial [Myxococcota bacterium]|nr:phosphopentomutase [Myxococcota bacterium]